MTDRIEKALREWQSKQNMHVMYDDEIYSLAAHLKAAGLVSVEESDIVNAVAEVGHGQKFGSLDPAMRQNAVDIAKDALRRALTTPSDGGGE